MKTIGNDKCILNGSICFIEKFRSYLSNKVCSLCND